MAVWSVQQGADDVDVRSTGSAAAIESDSADADAIDIALVIEDREQARSAAQLDTSMAEASLAALRENGVLPGEASLAGDGPSLGLVHYVDCLPDSCDLIVQWAAGNGFQASAPVVTLGHGGVEELHIELRQVLAADAAAMTTSATTVADAVAALVDASIDDLTYSGWAPELVTEGGQP